MNPKSVIVTEVVDLPNGDVRIRIGTDRDGRFLYTNVREPSATDIRRAWADPHQHVLVPRPPAWAVYTLPDDDEAGLTTLQPIRFDQEDRE